MMPRSRHFPRRHNWRVKEKDRNAVAAFLAFMSTTLLCTAVIQPKWFHLRSEYCSPRTNLDLSSFVYLGEFVTVTDSTGSHLQYTGYDQVLTDCVSPVAVWLIRILIGLLILAVFFSFCNFLLDISGVSVWRCCNTFRKHSAGNILSALLCVTSIVVCYLISVEIQQLYTQTAVNRSLFSPSPTRIIVKFDVGFYLTASSGCLSVLAIAVSLLCVRRKRYVTRRLSDDSGNLVAEDGTSFDSSCSIDYPSVPPLIHAGMDGSPMQYLPPPPFRLPPPPPYMP